MFLLLPFDIRLIIYDLILAETLTVQQSIQPSNAHIRFLHTSSQVYHEARPSFRRYISLRNEFQIERFHNYISSSPETALSVHWADVANDGRIMEFLHAGRVCAPLASLPQLLIQPSPLGRAGFPAISRARQVDLSRKVARLRCSPLSPLYHERSVSSHQSFCPLTVACSPATAVPS